MHDILARDNIPLAVNQVEFSILRQLPEKSGLLEEMKKRNVTCLGCTSSFTFPAEHSG
jgi:diketogulonate reductase-like aldo/keto reductase